MNFRDILQAKANGNGAMLSELSLSRVYQHFQDSGKHSFAILSAFRSYVALGLKDREAALPVNRKRNKALANDLRALSLGFSKLLGHWPECKDASTAYKDCPESEKILATEESVFVNGLTLPDLITLLQKYDQDAGVYVGPESEGKAWLVYKEGNHDVLGSLFSPNAVQKIFSKMKGSRTFVFEYLAHTYTEALIEQAFWKNHPDLNENRCLEACLRDSQLSTTIAELKGLLR